MLKRFIVGVVCIAGVVWFLTPPKLANYSNPVPPPPPLPCPARLIPAPNKTIEHTNTMLTNCFFIAFSFIFSLDELPLKGYPSLSTK